MTEVVRKYKIHLLNPGISQSKDACYTIEVITDVNKIPLLANF
ncbi:MAG: hypothetical protein ABJB76_05835 [Candidatus Nitrosocosmicus sp.]